MLKRELNLARPDDIYNAIVDAHKGMTDEQVRAYDAKLILLLVNHVGDEAVIREGRAALRAEAALPPPVVDPLARQHVLGEIVLARDRTHVFEGDLAVVALGEIGRAHV